MSLLKPKGKESERDFISRCTNHPIVKKDFKKINQRFDVCYNIWDKYVRRIAKIKQRISELNKGYYEESPQSHKSPYHEWAKKKMSALKKELKELEGR